MKQNKDCLFLAPQSLNTDTICQSYFETYVKETYCGDNKQKILDLIAAGRTEDALQSIFKNHNLRSLILFADFSILKSQKNAHTLLRVLKGNAFGARILLSSSSSIQHLMKIDESTSKVMVEDFHKFLPKFNNVITKTGFTDYEALKYIEKRR